MKNKNIVYGLIGLVLGVALSSIFYLSAGNYNHETKGNGMHKMPDGTIMTDDGMTMGSMMDGMMAGLYGKTGDEFDKEFLAEMIVHHQGAVEMAQLALKNGKHAELKDMATGIITAQNKEIQMMKQWQAQWYK